MLKYVYSQYNCFEAISFYTKPKTLSRKLQELTIQNSFSTPKNQRCLRKGYSTVHLTLFLFEARAQFDLQSSWIAFKPQRFWFEWRQSHYRHCVRSINAVTLSSTHEMIFRSGLSCQQALFSKLFSKMYSHPTCEQIVLSYLTDVELFELQLVVESNDRVLRFHGVRLLKTWELEIQLTPRTDLHLYTFTGIISLHWT